MANRKFEMYEYRQVLLRMRLGETDRALAKTGLMGRRKLGEVRRVAECTGWLDPARSLPDDATLAERFGKRAVAVSSVSLVEPFAEDVTRWWRDGIAATTIQRGRPAAQSKPRRYTRSGIACTRVGSRNATCRNIAFAAANADDAPKL